MSRVSRPQSYTAVQKEIGKRIQWVREMAEPNRAEFARIMGVDKSTLAKIEAGERAPSVFNVLDLAHRLRVSTDYILTGSLRGVDGEMAALLAHAHPDLLPDRPNTATPIDTSPAPRKPARRG